MILAFGNKARHGKDTCCNSIADFYASKAKLFSAHGLSFSAVPQIKRVNFADALRREVTAAISLVGDVQTLLDQGVDEGEPGVTRYIPSWATLDRNPDMTDPLLPHGKHPKLLQWWGTEYRRAQDPNYWVKKYREQVEEFKGVVVTGDLRFHNEAAAVKSLGGHTVNVTRLNEDGSPYVSPDRPADHPSETELDGYNWDYYIKSKSAALTGETAITISEYIRGLESK